MSYRIIFHSELSSTIKILRTRDPKTYQQLKKKIQSIADKPKSGKPLSGRLKGIWRVHIGPFVLFYENNDHDKTIVFLKFVHHDDAYN
jgi:addiction module RelE/StbE family toxin